MTGPESRTQTEITYKIPITPKLVFSILGPFVYEKVKEQLKAVLPISAFLFLFQFIVLQKGVDDALGITLGLSIVVLGLMFFMEGLRLGLMPLGSNIGATLPQKARMWLIMAFAVILGISVTFAEPAIATLQQAGASIDAVKAPLLKQLLTESSGLLVGAVGLGVGIATAFGVYRFARNWSLKLLLIPTLSLALVLTVVLALVSDETRGIIALAWDTGAVTTGPVTVPLVLSLGLGVSAILGKSDTGMSGFGIVTLASLWPVIMVSLLGLTLFALGSYFTPEAAAAYDAAASTGGEPPTFATLALTSVKAAAQAIIPLVLLLMFVQRVVLKEPIRDLEQIVLGIVFCLVGLALFGIGLESGLTKLGGQVGQYVPDAFTAPRELYGTTGGRIVAMVFTFVLGYGATMAEPALNALGITVEEVTAGAFKKAFLIQAVAVGVSVGLTAGIAKVMFDIPMYWLLIPPYLILIAITIFSEEKYVNIGWDSAGVTTGPITVPLVLAMGLAIGSAVGALDGFGMLAMASIGPILSVLLVGLYVSRFGNVEEAPTNWMTVEEGEEELPAVSKA